MADSPTQVDTIARDGEPTSVKVGAPRRLGRYELGGQLGAGGMAVVYQARDPTLDRELAIKLIRPVLRGPAGQARLLREAQAMARLEHPAVVPIFDVGVDGDDVFIVMPLLGRGTLGTWIHAAPRPWRAVLEHFLAAGRGLAAAHAAGIVHRDFKPDNVMLGAAGDVRVGDFGLAHSDGPSGGDVDGDELAGVAVDGELTVTGVRVGTPAYMAPEQITNGAVDARSDQFAFCVSLWEALYGTRPFRADPGGDAARLDELLGSIRSGALMPVPAAREVPAWLHAAMLRGLAPEPAARWPSMPALIDHLEGRRRRRAQVGIALGVAVPVAIVAAAVSVGAAGGAQPAAVIDPPAYRSDAITTTGRVAAAALSPDGDRLALVVDGAVQVVSTRGGAAEILIDDGATGAVLVWTGDGGLAVSKRDGAVHVVGGGGGPRTVASAPALLGCTVGGDVGHVRALVLAGAVRTVLAELADGSHAAVQLDAACRERARLPAPGWIAGLAVSRGRVWYLRGDGDGRTLVGLGPDGGVAEERLVDERAVALAGVAADGAAYLLYETGRWRVDELDVGGGPSRALATGSDPTEVKVSPDGTSLAWIEDDAGRPLRIAALAEVAARPAPVATGAMTVAWSPDARRLAAVFVDGGRAELRVIDRTGVVARRVAIDSIDLDLEDGLVWAGDDAVIATAADGRNLLRVELATGTGTTLLDGRGTASEPEVSPLDGTVAFLSARDGKGGEGVWLRSPAGKLSRLRAGLVSTLRIAWTHRGDAVLVHDLGADEVWRFNRRTGSAAALVDVPLATGERLSRLFPAGDGRMLARVNHTATDVHVSRPVPSPAR